MANIRFSDKPELTALTGTEIIPAQSMDGGTDTEAGAVAAGSDIGIPLTQLAESVRRSTVTTISLTADGALTIDYSLGDFFIVNLSANATSMTISNPPSGGGSIRVRFVQDSTGGYAVTQPTAAKAIDGTDTAVASAADAQSVAHYTTDDGGTTWGYSMKEIEA